MTKFAWVWKEIGVESTPWRYEPTIPVPFGDVNLVMLRNPKGARLQFDARYVDVTEVDPRLVDSEIEGYLDGIEVSGGARKNLMDTLVPVVQHLVAQVPVGRREDPGPDRQAAVGADRLEDPLADDAQQLGLQGGWQRIDLVQQHAPARSRSTPVKAPPDVAEHLALDQAGGQRATVDYQKGPAPRLLPPA
jgi:hypothetical protein